MPIERIFPDALLVNPTTAWLHDNGTDPPHFDRLDEFPADDATTHNFIPLPAMGDLWYSVSQGNPTAPVQTGNPIVIRSTMRGSVGTEDLDIRIQEAFAFRAALVVTNMSTDWTEFSYTLSTAEKASISNWNNLDWRITSTDGAGRVDHTNLFLEFDTTPPTCAVPQNVYCTCDGFATNSRPNHTVRFTPAPSGDTYDLQVMTTMPAGWVSVIVGGDATTGTAIDIHNRPRLSTDQYYYYRIRLLCGGVTASDWVYVVAPYHNPPTQPRPR